MNLSKAENPTPFVEVDLKNKELANVENAFICIEQAMSKLDSIHNCIDNIKKLVGKIETPEESFFNFLRSLQSSNTPEKNYQTYIIQDIDNHLLKIGKSQNPKRRIQEISAISGRNLKMLVIFEKDIEHELHLKFDQFRTIGEWFSIPQNLINDLISSVQHVLPLDND